MAAVKSPPKDLLPVGSRVTLRTDLIGVPAGTSGKVTLVNGLTWVRYWVHFDNGVRQGLIDRAKLATAAQWERRHDTVTAAVAGLGAAGSGGGGGPGSGSSSGSGSAETGGAANALGIPEHLLDRSRQARERLAAKAAG